MADTSTELESSAEDGAEDRLDIGRNQLRNPIPSKLQLRQAIPKPPSIWKQTRETMRR